MNNGQSKVCLDTQLSTSPPQKTIVLYDHGATPLFKRVEDGDWDTAESLLELDEKQASIWVVSTGTISTTFDWSVWKRLPLHEAVRRQAPISFVRKLIDAYPEACRQTTHSNELPIHLATQYGAEPEVVLLLATLHWQGLQAANSNRQTPRELLENAKLLDPEDQQIVVDALKASEMTWRNLEAKQQVEIDEWEARHATGIRALQSQQQSDLEFEVLSQEGLELQIAELQERIAFQNQTIEAQDAQMTLFKEQEEVSKARKQELEPEGARLKVDYNNHQAQKRKLLNAIRNYEDQAVSSTDQIAQLQAQLENLSHYQKNTIGAQLKSFELQMKTTESQLRSVMTTLTLHQVNLESLCLDDDDGKLTDITQDTSNGTISLLNDFSAISDESLSAD